MNKKNEFAIEQTFEVGAFFVALDSILIARSKDYKSAAAADFHFE